MRLEESAVYELDMKPEDTSTLLAPYDLLISVDGHIRIEIGRFSLTALPRIQLIANAVDECLVRIGSFCEVAHGSKIIVGGQHRNEALFNYTFGLQAKVFKAFVPPAASHLVTSIDAAPLHIGDNVLVSAGVTILSGIDIGSGTVIGASSLVSGNCEAGSIYAGVPARLIRQRFSPEMQELYRRVRLPDVMAHCLPDLPLLLDRLGRGEIELAEYLASVAFLPVRPVVHLSAGMAADSTLHIRSPVGYALGDEMISDPAKIELLDAYFAQMKVQEAAKIRWTPDIFHTIGLY
jgi:acetyltransferase-like isoleucine patch superfamily enzyme